MQQPDYFSHKAGDFDKNQSQVENVTNIARVMREHIEFNDTMEIADFGSGTGLLLERVAPHVRKITAIDISVSMNQQLRNKLADIACEVEIIEEDLARVDLGRSFDGIISSMTLHHVEDIPALLEKFHSMVHPGGFIALADLDSEDGSFHKEDTGVFHKGFDREALSSLATAAGFKDVTVSSASVVQKPYGNYPVFLLTGIR